METITSEDYYRKSVEFRLWLREKQETSLDRLSSKDARRYFDKFVKKWNRGDLSERYYKGNISTKTLVNAGATSTFQWSFKERQEGPSTSKPPPLSDAPFTTVKEKPWGERNPDRYTQEMDHEDRERYDRLLAKKKRQQERQKREELLDELVPRASGSREMALEKKRFKNEEIRKGETEKEDHNAVVMDERDLYGGGDSYQEALRRRAVAEMKRQERRQQKAQVTQERFQELNEKEEKTMSMLRAMAARYQQP